MSPDLTLARIEVYVDGRLHHTVMASSPEAAVLMARLRNRLDDLAGVTNERAIALY